ncbi:MAG: DNRLRE domain-containing protein [Candidatus Woesearchaeota archaeon]
MERTNSSSFLFLSIAIFVLVFVLKDSNAYTVERNNVTFVAGGNVYVDLKFSTTGYHLKDGYDNLVPNNSYVCNKENYLKALKDDFYDYYEGDSNGEWYFNGGSVGSPEITFDEEIFKILSDLVQCRSGMETCNNYTFQGATHENCYIYGPGDLIFNGKRTGCNVQCSKKDGVFMWGTAYCPEGLYSDWNAFFENRIKFSNVQINSGWNNDNGIRPFAVICKSDFEGIKCLALITGIHNDLRVLWPKDHLEDLLVVKNEMLEKAEFLKGSEIKSFEDLIENYNITDASDLKPGLKIKNTNVSLTFDSAVLSFNLVNDGELPLKITEVIVKDSKGKERNVQDLTNNLFEELDLNQNRSVSLLLKDEICDLKGEELSLIIKYQAENFICNYTVNSEAESKFEINEKSVLNFERKVFYPDYDFYVYSKEPKKNFDNRIDLHVGNKEGIMRSYVHYDISEIKRENLVRAYLKLTSFENSSLGEVSLNSIPNDWNFGKVSFVVKPKTGSLLEKKNITSGANNFDITEYVKSGRGFGFEIKAYDESIDQDIVFYALESDKKPKIILYYTGEGITLKELCK